MSLSEVVGASGLAAYAEVALVLFFAAFVAVMFQVTRGQLAQSLDEQSHLPFDDADEQSRQSATRTSEGKS